MGPHTFDPEKATEAILFVADRARGDMYATLKLLYLADKLHLHRYGRFLFGDEHYALPYGPVPQGAYDLVKYVRGTSNEVEYPPAREAFVLEGNTIRTLRDVDTSVFSDSDEECLNEVLDRFRSPTCSTSSCNYSLMSGHSCGKTVGSIARLPCFQSGRHRDCHARR
jgi:uncharacterized phage-associated protein